MSDYGLDAPTGKELAEAAPGRRTNKFPAWCRNCKQPVPIGAGYISRDPVTSKWRTEHIDCGEQQVAPTGDSKVIPAVVVVLTALTESIHAVRHSKKTLRPECGCNDLASKVWTHLGGPK